MSPELDNHERLRWLEQNATLTNPEAGILQQTSEETQPLELKYDLAMMRQAKVLKYMAMGLNQSEIAEAVGVHKSTVSRDIQSLTKAAKQDIQTHITETLPLQYKVIWQGVQDLVRLNWRDLARDTDTRSRAIAKKELKDLYALQLAMLGDPGVIEKAMVTVSKVRNALDSGAASLEETQEEVTIP